MKRFAIFAIGILIAGLLPTSGRAANNASACSQPVCFYLPMVVNPPPAQVVETALGQTRGNYYAVLFGSIVNVTSRPIYDVKIEVSLYDGTNQLVGTWTATTILTATLPEQANPFAFETTESLLDTPGPHRVAAHIVSWTTTNTQVYHPVTIVNVSKHVSPYGDTALEVELRNDDPVALTNVQVAIWGYAQPPQIMKLSLVNSLLPGATTTLSAFLRSYSGPIHVVAQGNPAP
jgi:hypothetical protein